MSLWATASTPTTMNLVLGRVVLARKGSVGFPWC